MQNKHISAHYVIQNEEDTIIASINSIYDYCDEILIAMDDRYGWSGMEIVPDSTLEKVRSCGDKIKVFIGRFNSEHEQRNFLISQSSNHITHFLAIDGDEVYSDFSKLYDIIEDNEDIGLCVPCHVYFRRKNWAVITDNGSCFPNYHLQIVHKNRIFTALRTPNVKEFVHVDPNVCHFEHYSYSKSPRKIWEKINTFSHSHEFDTLKWFEEVWMPCTLESGDLHPTNPHAFSSLFENDVDLND